MIVSILQLLCIQQNLIAQDTLTAPKLKRHMFKPEPLRATMLAVSFPGLGQIYNKKYWKIPLVYGGFGGLIYSIRFNSANYTKFMKAYQDFTDLIPATQSYRNIIKTDIKLYDPVLSPTTYIASNASYYKDALLRMVDYYKRYRDLSYIGIAGWYLVTILDANVDASLFNYDVGPNLELTVFPVQMSSPVGYTVASLNVGLKITF